MMLSPTTVNAGPASSLLGCREGAYIDAELTPFHWLPGDASRTARSSSSEVNVTTVVSPSSSDLGLCGGAYSSESLGAMGGDPGVEARFTRLASGLFTMAGRSSLSLRVSGRSLVSICVRSPSDSCQGGWSGRSGRGGPVDQGSVETIERCDGEIEDACDDVLQAFT